MFQRPTPRNEEGASPGGGAPAAVVATDTQAQGNAPSGVVTMDALKSVLTEAMASVRNGIHADLRKAGVYDTKPAKASTQVDATTPTTQASSPHTDYQQLLARETAFTRAVASAGLTDEQYSVVDETYRAVNPPDPRAWATGFLKAMGLGKKEPTASPQPVQTEHNKQATGVPATPAQPAQAKPAANISDMGPSASSAARDPEAIIRHRITDATGDDFERLAAQHGRDKAHQMWAAEARAQLRSIKLVPPGRQR